MDERRVVRLRTPHPVSAIDFRFGSGYQIGTDIVLTAAHVLSPPDDDDSPPKSGDGCQVLRNGDDHESGWQDGQVLAGDMDLDVALVKVPGLGDALPVQWGRLSAGIAPMRWQAMGFPIAGLEDEERLLEAVWGELSPASERSAGTVPLKVQSREARPQPDDSSGWAGLSGAAVFCHGRLVGVVTEDPTAWEDSLRAVRVECLVRRPELYSAVSPMQLDAVSAAGVHIDPLEPMHRWVLLVAGLLKKAGESHCEIAGARLGLMEGDWSAEATRRLLAERLLHMTIDELFDPLVDLIRGLGPVDGLRLIDYMLPVWVAPEAADNLRSLVETDDAHLLVANLRFQDSVRDYLRRAWCCDVDDCQIIGVPGMFAAGEEGIVTALDDVAVGVTSVLGATPLPHDVGHRFEVFVLIGPGGDAKDVATEVLASHPRVRTVLYCGVGDGASADLGDARLIEPAIQPEDEATARNRHSQLVKRLPKANTYA